MGERLINPKFNVHENYNEVNIINPYRYASAGNVPTDMLHYFKFNNDLVDDGSASATLTDGGSTAITYVSGKINQSSVWGANKYATMASNIMDWGDGATDTPFTYNFWIKYVSVSGVQVVAMKRANTSSAANWQINNNGTAFKMVLFDGSTANFIDVSGSISAGSWINVSIKYDGSQAHTGFTMKFDNVDVGTSSTGGTYVANTGSNSIVVFGANGQSPFNIFKLNGELDMFRVFDRELTDDEETALYNGGVGVE